MFYIKIGNVILIIFKQSIKAGVREMAVYTLDWRKNLHCAYLVMNLWKLGFI